MDDRADGVAISTVSLPRSTRHPLHLVALNFRVPFQVRQKIKTYAVLHGASMTDVLIAALRSAGVLDEN